MAAGSEKTTGAEKAQSTRPRLRADAERNRARVLNAARELFAERGAEVSMDEVARRAEVGIGTLYRHFPTKEAMVIAAGQQRFGEILTYYRTVCRDSAEPLQALHLLLTRIAEVESRDRGFATAVTEGSLGSEGPRSPLREDLEAELMALIGKGQEGGSIRQDMASVDILSLTCGLTSIVHRRSGDWRRYIDIMLDGLKSQAA
ncbi:MULTISPECIES: TetR/AcrR family transcriptional regulator [Streptomyces]|uniref:Putative TetR/AcrR-family transcriptional regulator n=1 Tax=Streptomyces albus (strain ATCC 21838 / DSM 41398 / FERM P-419 / JCM 4703 / NBRC 107858) TaxID=1081613 RepID=A0A0B5ERP3_STRA4|nr:TetR/AcrR family transcriptional regulator [Streptomyces sp. SCSIO ZS0520]AJE85488.1 putative TetR/AcrR-family transcriptional regulator [Streptomyces albus]AOU79791.1 putative TetR/AcrR-family transcriptional regulator [Streptomyces albus]AYN35516.1 TetR/AcrR family transcriptional regulator [Streptomyces albus]